MFEFGHPLAAPITRVNTQLDLALTLTAGCAFSTQLLEASDPTDRARTPGFDALADPDFFLRQKLIGAGVGQRFLVQHLLFAVEISLPTPRKTDQVATIEFNDSGGDPLQKTTIVSNEEERAAGSEKRWSAGTAGAVYAGDAGIRPVRAAGGPAFAGRKQRFKPLDRDNVKVVGWFIQQKDVWLRGQSLREGNALFLAAR